MNSIQVDKKTRNEIFAQAKAEYPGEACGWIIKNADGALTYFPAANLQDKYHKLDSESYPRTSKDAFLMDSLKLNNAIEEATSVGGELFSIVHSHIDCGAYFSDEDKHQMTLPDGSGPVFPASCYLVVSVDKGEEGETAAFVFNKDTKDYDLVKVELV
ncbi:MAG: Mov34/MPN/PAD-1 family protein [Leptospirales bacterium]